MIRNISRHETAEGLRVTLATALTESPSSRAQSVEKLFEGAKTEESFNIRESIIEVINILANT